MAVCDTSLAQVCENNNVCFYCVITSISIGYRILAIFRRLSFFAPFEKTMWVCQNCMIMLQIIIVFIGNGLIH